MSSKYEMNKNETAKLDYSTPVARQRDYFLAGNTRPLTRG
jgi:hypothetical protein